MDKQTLYLSAGGIAAVGVLYFLMRSGNQGGTASVSGYTGSQDPTYLTYNYPDYPGQAGTVVVKYVPPEPQPPQGGNTAETLTRPCPCSSGCGSDGIYAKALNSIMSVFVQSTNALVNAYQSAMVNQLPDYVKQYINNDAGYIASQRALKAIGTSYGAGNNLPFDATSLTQPPYQIAGQ